MMVKIVLSLSLLLTSITAMSAPSESQFELALSEIKAEEVVFDASWSKGVPPLLIARVFDNGSPRNGYAGYLCMIMAEHAINAVIVSVVDVVSKDHDELGRADCSQLKR